MDTIYIKILDDSGNAVRLEEIVSPGYVYTQPRNGQILRCISSLAQGILDAKGEKIYQLIGKQAVARAVATAVIITPAEYQELVALLEQTDPEDTAPEIPAGSDGATIMTRAELTEKVNELDEALNMILSGVTE